VVWLVGQAVTPMAQDSNTARIHLRRARQDIWSWRAVATIALLILFLLCYIALTLKWEDFADYDNSQFTLFLLRGHDFRPAIWPQVGRFFPLSNQEFNLIRHFTSTVVGYHVLPIFQVVALSGVLLILHDDLSISARAALTIFVLVVPSIVISFGTLICTERNVVLSIACLVLFVKRFEQAQSIGWAVGAVLCAQIMLYYKETAFLLLFGFALGRLILRCKNPDRPGWDQHRLRDRESRLDICLASLGVLFLLYYVAIMLPHPSMQYADQARLPLATVFLAYIKVDLLAWLLVAIVLGRTYLILRGGVVPSLLWDGLAFGGVACFAAYLYLSMFSAYYLAPVDLVAALCLGRLAILSWREMGWRSRVPALILISVALLQDASVSAFSIFERKNVIHGKAEIARVVEAQYGVGAGNTKRLFFPFASPYTVMEFASYLDYRGVPVEGVSAKTGPRREVQIVSRTVQKDGRCMYYASPVCHYGARPDPGDLVIVLPDDDGSLAQITPYRERGDLLLPYEPRPPMAQWLYPLVRQLRIASPLFAFKELPDRWLDASVTVWN
jgi:hypothetical protein